MFQLKTLRIVGITASLLLLAGSHTFAYMQGRGDVKEKMTKEKAQLQAELNRVAAERDMATARVEWKHVETIKYIHVKGEEREKQVEVFVPVDSGYLPAGFRVFHDAAVQNQLPSVASIAKGAPVAATDVARTVNYNYTLCHKAYARVAAWEEWDQKMREVE